MDEVTNATLVTDIRRAGSSTGLAQDILVGLRARPRSLPSLLLWDALGLRLFDKLTNDATYYPAKKEYDILKSNVNKIATRIAPGSVIIELGSGNLSKTAMLLKTLADRKKPFEYFALDVSPTELQNSLTVLAQRLPKNAQDIRGICGTYDDLAWALNNSLHHLRSTSLTFIWFGNGAANAPGVESFGFLKNLLNKVQRGPKAQAIVAIDGCLAHTRVMKAYESDISAQREFLMNGLQGANRFLDQEVFINEDWELATAFDVSRGLLTQDYVAKGHLDVVIGHERFKIKAGEHVNICQSGKWDSAMVNSLATRFGMCVLREWQHEDEDYGIYLLCNSQD